MHDSVKNFLDISKSAERIVAENNTKIPKIIAVSKTFPIEKILPLIDHGHTHFGENKVQEAIEKWTEVKKSKPNIKLHLIGKLQSNKVKSALDIFDFIHSLDNEKLVKKISKEQEKKTISPKIFIQVNIGNEVQKSGVDPKQVKEFYNFCLECKLNIIGLMCIPPMEKDPEFFFHEMEKLKEAIKVDELSMGMSADYNQAIKCSSSFIRVGSKIFGSRV